MKRLNFFLLLLTMFIWMMAMSVNLWVLPAFGTVEFNGWVTVDGTKFKIDGKDFHYVGTNNYYLGIDPNRTQAEVDEVFEDAKNMGANVIRIWGFNDGPGGFQTAAGVYDESVFQKLDYAIKKAGESGIKLIIPFVNNWDDYGGMNQYVDWSTTKNPDILKSTNNSWGQGAYHNQFYTDTDSKNFYKNHISTLLNRTNTYNSVQYKNDPTILGWELANEPRVEGDWSGDILDTWISEMAAYVKSIDSDHLLATGMEGFYDENGVGGWKRNGWTGTDFVRHHQDSNIDFATFHVWPDAGHGWGFNYDQTMDWVQRHIDESHGTSLNKPVILEEYGQKSDENRDQYYQGFLQKITANEAAGSNFWILYHDDYPDYDGFGVYYNNDDYRYQNHPDGPSGDKDTTDIIIGAVADMKYLNENQFDTLDLNQSNLMDVLGQLPVEMSPSGPVGSLTYSNALGAPGLIGDISLTGFVPNYDYLLSFEGVPSGIHMTAEELAAVGVSYYDDLYGNGRWTTPGGTWTASASGDYGEFAGMEVLFVDFMLITTDGSGSFSDKFFFNAFGDMASGWYETRFIVKDAHSWTIHDYTGSWRNEALFANNLDFDPPATVPLTISIDIKPQSCPNPLNVNSQGLLPVAILGTVDLDVEDIDVATLAIDGVAPVKSAFEDVATPTGLEPCDCLALSGDGTKDLVLKFKIQEIVDILPPAVQNGDLIPLTITGELLDGTVFEGIDCILIRGVK